MNDIRQRNNATEVIMTQDECYFVYEFFYEDEVDMMLDLESVDNADPKPYRMIDDWDSLSFLAFFPKKNLTS